MQTSLKVLQYMYIIYLLIHLRYYRFLTIGFPYQDSHFWNLYHTLSFSYLMSGTLSIAILIRVGYIIEWVLINDNTWLQYEAMNHTAKLQSPDNLLNIQKNVFSCILYQAVMWPGQFFLAWVGPAIFDWVWVWKISPKNTKFFIFSPLDQAKKYPGQRLVGLLFTAGQKYVQVGSGPISSIKYLKIKAV